MILTVKNATSAEARERPAKFRPGWDLIVSGLSLATAKVAFRTARIIYPLKLFQSTVQIHESHIFISSGA